MLRRRRTTRRPGKFDPNDDHRVKHTRIGVWDLYEERQTMPPIQIPGSSSLETYSQIIQCIPHVVRMLKDILNIKNSWLLLSTFLVLETLESLLPAISLWYVAKLYATLCEFMTSIPRYSGQLLHLVISSFVLICIARLSNT